jgi:hypothetical protein
MTHTKCLGQGKKTETRFLFSRSRKKSLVTSLQVPFKSTKRNRARARQPFKPRMSQVFNLT